MITFKSYLQQLNEYDFDPDAVKRSNSSARSAGAVGSKAITPRYLRTIAGKDDSILDFGAGNKAAHTQALRADGYTNVTAHEFGGNQNELHDPDALNRQYDHVMASNVLNTQSNLAMLQATLDQIYNAVKVGGNFVGNYPQSPRYHSDFDHETLKNEIEKRFGEGSYKVVGGSKKTPLFHVTKMK